ncbi:MAG: DNA polymerase Y family protein [Acidimicrobiia bacterium]|nr:DNA polymerase Y family protein [Acidimicrobiia bacterium]
MTLFASLAGPSLDGLLGVAREFSPRVAVETCGVTLDVSGVARLFGDARTLAAAIEREAAGRGMTARVAVASTHTAAYLLACTRPGVTVVEPGDEARAVGASRLEIPNPQSPIPKGRAMSVAGEDREVVASWVTNAPLANPQSPIANAIPNPQSSIANAIPNPQSPIVNVLLRWGLRTLGEFARLPADGVAARLGQAGVRWQRVARGDDLEPFVPTVPEERFEDTLDLEWPIEGLEPLSFILTRLLEPLAGRLARRGRGAAALHVHLHLVTRDVHTRTLVLPAPIGDAKTLRTLALLDLESHLPPAGIDRVTVSIDPAPGRVLQYSLLVRPLPTPAQLSTLLARLDALMGAGRCGAPAVVDSWRPGAFALRPFRPPDRVPAAPPPGGQDAARDLVLRRFRSPVPVRVRTASGTPASVMVDRRGPAGGRVQQSAGPWRASGGWREVWDRDEWDVTLAGGGTYRLFRDRATAGWFIEGEID